MKVNLSIFKLFVLFLFHTISVAQTSRKPDIIVLRNNTKLEVVIQEVQEHIIKYKKLSAADGPSFSLDKQEISSILYGNGEVETFNKVEKDVFFNDQSAINPIETTTRPVARNKFEEEMYSLTPRQLRKSYQFYKSKSKKGLVSGIVWTVLGTVSAGVGTILILNTDVIQTPYATYTYNNHSDLGAGLIIGGLAGGIAFGTMGFVRAGKNGSKSTRIKRELERRGESLIFNFRPVINPSSQLAGLSLKMSF